MATNKKKTPPNSIAQNRKVRHDYAIEDTFEAGLSLEGWEVKSLRENRVQMSESYIFVRNNELWWFGGHITPLLTASTHIQADAFRNRKLLMHRKEIDKLIGKVDRKGYTIVPISLFWKRGRAKIDIGLAKGKKDHDKRFDDKARDWKIEQGRIMKHGR